MFESSAITEDFSINMHAVQMNAITENISINQSKRGRPYLLFDDANDKREWKKQNPDVRTDRTLVNRVYSLRALSVLGEGHEPEFTWLADANAGMYRRTVLGEQGRINDDQEIRDLAKELCKRKPKTATAIALIRSWRGVLKPATQQGITRALYRAVNRWRAANPSGTLAQVQEALRLVQVTIEGRLMRQQTATASASGSMSQSPG